MRCSKRFLFSPPSLEEHKSTADWGILYLYVRTCTMQSLSITDCIRCVSHGGAVDDP